MSITFKLDGALLPFQSVRLNGGPGGVQGLPSSAWYGEPLTAGLTIEDPSGSLDLVGWHTFTVDEPACTSAPRIFTGWITGRTIHRGVYRTGAGRVWECDIIDQNALFSLELFRASSARRPAETDLVRAQFAIDSAPMAGTPVAVTSRTNLTDNPRNFGDSDYITQYPVDLFTSITATVGKNFYAYWDEGEQAIGLHYDLVGANPASTLRVSNVIADVDSTTTFAPLIDAVLERSPEDIYTGILFGYRGAYVYARRQATIDALSPSLFSPNQFRRDLVYRTDRVGLLATATSLVESMLEERAIEKDILRVTVQLPAAKVNLIHAGMALDLKFSHLPGYESFTTVAVVRRDVVPTDGHDSLYDVHLECTNAAKAAGPGGGTGHEFPHEPCEAPSVVQFKAQNGAGEVSMTFDTDPGIGNLLIFATTVRSAGTAQGITGWTLSPEGTLNSPSGDSGGVAIYYRIADGDPEDAGAQTNWTGVDDTRAMLVEVAMTGATIDDSSEATTEDVLTATGGSVAPTASQTAFIVTVIGYNTGGDTFPYPDPVPSGGATSLMFDDGNGGHHPVMWLGYEAVTSTTGTYQHTITFSGFAPNGDEAGFGQTLVFVGESGDCCPDAGQWVEEMEVVVLSGADGVTACPFADLSLHVYIDDIEQTAKLVSQDGATGEFTLGFTPRPAMVCTVRYQGR